MVEFEVQKWEKDSEMGRLTLKFTHLQIVVKSGDHFL